jgi:hypothetical protein
MKHILPFLLGLLLVVGCSGSNAGLHRAANEGDLATVKRLIASGANVNARDERGSTPLHYAANQYHAEVIEFLLENGAQVNAQQDGGTTALHHAVVAKGPEIARILLEHGADPNIRAGNGLTALDMAEMMGRTETVKLLNEYNAKRGKVEIGVIEPGNQVEKPADAKYKMVVYSPAGKEIPELTSYGTEIIQTPSGGTTLVVSPSSRLSLELQRFPSGARADIIELSTGKVVFSKEY